MNDPIFVDAYVPVSVDVDYDSPTKWGGYREKIVHAIVPVEVLTVHFSRRRMRVRYTASIYGKEKVQTADISADPFFNKYDLVIKE